MSRMTTGLFAAAMILGVSVKSQAAIDLGDAQALQIRTMAIAKSRGGLKWKVGDEANYKIAIGGFINGTAHEFDREDNGTQIWVQEDMDLGAVGKQKLELQFEKATGQILKILANGQEQKLPSASDYTVVESKQDHITTAAGAFDCIYVKVQSNSDKKIQEEWINPQAIPVGGMLKAVSDSQFGAVNQDITSFKFAP
jgi:hypothetical protein